MNVIEIIGLPLRFWPGSLLGAPLSQERLVGSLNSVLNSFGAIDAKVKENLLKGIGQLLTAELDKDTETFLISTNDTLGILFEKDNLLLLLTLLELTLDKDLNREIQGLAHADSSNESVIKVLGRVCKKEIADKIAGLIQAAQTKDFKKLLGVQNIKLALETIKAGVDNSGVDAVAGNIHTLTHGTKQERIALLSDQNNVQIILEGIYKFLEIETRGIENKAKLIADFAAIVVQGELDKKVTFFCNKENLQSALNILSDFVNVRTSEQQRQFLQDLEIDHSNPNNNLMNVILAVFKQAEFRKFLPTVAIELIELLINSTNDGRSIEQSQLTVREKQEEGLVQRAKQLRKNISETITTLKQVCKHLDGNSIKWLEGLIKLKNITSLLTHSPFSLEQELSEKFEQLDSFDIGCDDKRITQDTLKQDVISYYKSISQLVRARITMVLPVLLAEKVSIGQAQQTQETIRQTMSDICNINGSKWAGKLAYFASGNGFGALKSVVTKDKQQEKQTIVTADMSQYVKKIQKITPSEIIGMLFAGNFTKILKALPEIIDDNNMSFKDKMLKTLEVTNNQNKLLELKKARANNHDNSKCTIKRSKSEGDLSSQRSANKVIHDVGVNNNENDTPTVINQQPKTQITIVVKKSSVKPYIPMFVLLISSVVMFNVGQYKHSVTLLYASMIVGLLGAVAFVVKGIQGPEVLKSSEALAHQ